MVSTGKARHISANLGDDHFGCVAGDPGDGIQQAHRFVKRAADRLDPRIKAGNRLIEAVNLAQQLRQHKPVMGFHPAVQCLRQ